MKSTFMIILLQTLVGYFTPLAYAQTKSANTSTAREIEIVPGNSLGGTALKDSRASLTQRGFVEDPVRQSKDYLLKDQIMARMENDAVVQLWFVGSDYSLLRLRGKTFPKTNQATSLRKFFARCKPDVQGSGGVLIYCENDGVELSYSLRGSKNVKFDGLSVVSSDLVNKILHGP